jgi:hypothetical protein
MHDAYVELEAGTRYELGLRRGRAFAGGAREAVDDVLRAPPSPGEARRLNEALNATRSIFPHYIEELEGYAEGASVPFAPLWTVFSADDLPGCTSVVVNRGALLAHNEDWSIDAAESLWVLRSRLQGVETLELFYENSFGGNAVSVNSHGVVQMVNTLTHSDRGTGVPRGVIGRWLSETSNPVQDLQAARGIQRASGFSHTLVCRSGEAWNLECSAMQSWLRRVAAPFAHTNHYLTPDAPDGSDDLEGTVSRLHRLQVRLDKSMSRESLLGLLCDRSLGKHRSVFNERTIGQMLVDFEAGEAAVWLLRENARGWVTYPLPDAPRSSGAK